MAGRRNLEKIESYLLKEDSAGVSKATFAKLDHLVWQRIQLSKSAQWVKDSYFSTVNGRGWIFSEGSYIFTTHSQFPIARHLKVRGNKSAYDGDLPYWAGRF